MEPFRIDVHATRIEDLRYRLANTRWPGAAAAGWDRGVPAGWLRELAGYWAHGYDWPAAQARLNGFAQFTECIDGTSVHFVHVRSPEPAALPLVLTHGWPGSVVEFLDVIGPLTDPRAHGGHPADAFHLVIPTVPGFCLSGPTGEPGWNVSRTGRAWLALMRRLGYGRYGVHGGDFGALISLEMRRMAPPGLVGAHVNFLITPPGDPDGPAGRDPVEQTRLESVRRFRDDPAGYVVIQATRPQTLAYALDDSPVGLLAWIADRFQAWTDPARDDLWDRLDRDQFLTNVMLYWLTGTAGSAAHFYREVAAEERARADQPPAPGTVPLGVAVFPHDFVLPVRRLAERILAPVTHWSEFDRGGHFPAMEQPGLLVEDLRAFFRMLR